MSDDIHAKQNGHSYLIADAYGPEMEDIDLDALRQEMVENGLDYYSPSRQTKIAAIRSEAKAQALAARRGRIEKVYSSIRAMVQFVGQTVLLLVTLVISYLLLPVAVLGLGYAEYQRVAAGVQQFDPPRAGLMSAVAVSTYLLLLFIQAQMLHAKPDYQQPVWSLRITARRMRYWLGLGQWQEQYKGTFELLRGAIGFLAGMIILLGTAGALHEEIAVYDGGGAWHDALLEILTASDLPTFLNLVGGVMLTAALLAGLHFVVMLTYQRYVQLVPDGALDFFEGSADYAAEMDRAEALYLMGQLMKAKQRQQGQQKQSQQDQRP